MMMITGGAFSGKLEFARKHFELKEDEVVCGADCGLADVFTAKCVDHYELVVRRLLENGAGQEAPEAFTERFIRENPEAIVIMDEIGGGIIPLEKSERLWREQTGRAGCRIAERSDTVIRLCCGLPAVLKGTLG